MSDAAAVHEARVRGWYESAQWRFRAFEKAVGAHLRRTLVTAGMGRLQVDTRTKALDSFVTKALAAHPADAERLKYDRPETQVTDFVGARVVVPLSTDVQPVRDVLAQRYLVVEEDARGAAEHLEVPGYQSLHLLLALAEPDRADPDFRDMEDLVVEVQVRTTLQHAWASLQHDLQYKADRPASPAVRRRLTALAGMLELADREFVQVREQHGLVRPAPVAGMPGASEDLTVTSVRGLVEQVLGARDDGADVVWFEVLQLVLTELGLKTVGEVLEALGEWADRADQVDAVVRASRPWVMPAVVFDELLQLALGADYVERRAARSEVDPVEARRDAARRRADLLRAVEA